MPAPPLPSALLLIAKAGASPDATLLPAGQAVTERDLATTLADIQARVAELSIQQNRASQTTQTAQKLGAVGLLVLSSRQKFMHAP